MGFPYFGQPVVFGEPIGMQAGGAEETLASYLAGLGNDLWLRFNETSGNPIQYGTLAGLTITQTACTQGQTGIRDEPNEAYGFDGATSNGSIVSVANNATLKAMTTQRWMVALKADSLGASNTAKILTWGNIGASDHLILGLASNNRVQSTINTNGTNAAAISNTNQISDIIGNPSLLFMDFDDADVLGDGRRIRLFKAVGGVVTQLTLATDTEAVGDVDQPTTPLNVGNRTARDITYDGLFDELTGKAAALWTTEEMQLLASFFS